MEKWNPNISVRAVKPVIQGINELGYNSQSILSQINTSFEQIDRPDERIPHYSMMKLWEFAESQTGDNFIGIHLAEKAPIESFGLHSYALLSSPTLREAFRRGCRYQRLIHEATNLVFEEGENEAIIRHSFPDGQTVPRHPSEFLVTTWLRFGRLIVGNQWFPSRVLFAHSPPQETSEYSRVFGCPVNFITGQTAMSIPNQFLDIPNPQTDKNLLRILDEYAKDLLKRLPQKTTFAEIVKARLIEKLPEANLSVQNIAKSLKRSVRTLHRELEAEGTGFRKILQQTRFEQAVNFLGDQKYSIEEIAYLLGYSELSTFYRAFKSWVGKPPAEYRSELLKID